MQESIKLQQQRMMIHNDSYVMESPDVGNRKMNGGKAGVQLAPL